MRCLQVNSYYLYLSPVCIYEIVYSFSHLFINLHRIFAIQVSDPNNDPDLEISEDPTFICGLSRINRYMLALSPKRKTRSSDSVDLGDMLDACIDDGSYVNIDPKLLCQVILSNGGDLKRLNHPLLKYFYVPRNTTE